MKPELLEAAIDNLTKEGGIENDPRFKKQKPKPKPKPKPKQKQKAGKNIYTQGSRKPKPSSTVDSSSSSYTEEKDTDKDKDKKKKEYDPNVAYPNTDAQFDAGKTTKKKRTKEEVADASESTGKKPHELEDKDYISALDHMRSMQRIGNTIGTLRGKGSGHKEKVLRALEAKVGVGENTTRT